MSSPNGTISYWYDDWGRMTQKNKGYGWVATYGYRYGSRLYSVASTFPGEGTVTYQTGGDGKRRTRTIGFSATRYYWDQGYTVVNEANLGNALTRTYVGRNMAHVDGTSPSTGAYNYYLTDHLGSTRALYDQSKALVGEYDYAPYGEDSASGTSLASPATHLYTGHDWDATSALYFAPYRYYNPSISRWITRDPLGMVDGPNVYAYVLGNPVIHIDPLGLQTYNQVYSHCLFQASLGDIDYTGPTLSFVKKYIKKKLKAWIPGVGWLVTVGSVMGAIQNCIDKATPFLCPKEEDEFDLEESMRKAAIIAHSPQGTIGAYENEW